MPEQLKYYVAPLVALVAVCAWFLLRPLPATDAEAGDASSAADVEGGGRAAALVRPLVKPLDPKVEGGVSKPGVIRYVGEHLDDLEACYGEALKRSPGAAGRLIMTVAIDGEGHVAAARVAASQVADERVGPCFGRVIAKIDFPRPPGGDTTTVTYPFQLSAKVEAAVNMDDPPTG